MPLLSAFAVLSPQLVTVEVLQPALATILFGAVTGSGLLTIFRHGASLGGVGIVALMAQERLGWRAGWVQLEFDAALFAAALLVLSPRV